MYNRFIVSLPKCSAARVALVSALAASLLGAGPAAAVQQQRPGPVRPIDAETLFQQAVELHQAGDILGAIQTYLASLNLEPDNAGAHSNLGAAYVRLGRYEEAILQYRRALELDADNPTFRLNLGLAYYKSARIPDAVEAFRAVLAQDKAHLNARLLLADCYLQMGQYQDVVDLLALYEDEYADNLAFAYVLGTAFIETRRVEEGQRVIDRIFATGDSAQGHLLMATAMMATGDNPGALARLKEAAALEPTLPLVHSLMGRALLRTGDQEGAATAFARELQINPNDFQANLEIGDLKKRNQQFDEAEPYITRALRMRPHDPTAQFSLAGLHVSRGEADRAREVLEALVADTPQFTEAYVLLATVYYRLQRREDGDRVRGIIERLNAEVQATQPGSRASAGPPASSSSPP